MSFAAEIICLGLKMDKACEDSILLCNEDGRAGLRLSDRLFKESPVGEVQILLQPPFGQLEF